MRLRRRRRALSRSVTVLALMVATSITTIGAGVLGTAPASASSTTGVTAKQITIGATVPLTGPAASGYSEIAPAMDAVFNWVNAHGGVYGRKIKYIYLDDEYNPAKTATLTRQLVLQDHIFADVGSLGTPTQLSVQKYLNSQKIPQMFIESGCNCWSNKRYPYSFGWEPPYTVEGKLLGNYVKQHFAGKKIGFLYQDTTFGQDVMKGAKLEIPASAIVSEQNYNVTTLSGPLTTQMSALKAAGAQVVIMGSIPAATALAMLPAFAIGYTPQYLIDSVGSDAPTVGPLLAAFTALGGGSAATAKATAALLNGVITDAYLPPEGLGSSPWVVVTKKLLQKYAPGVWKKDGLNGNTEYGVALAYTFVQALKAAGKNLTRAALMKALEKKGHSLTTAGLVPLSYSNSVHYGYEGGEVVEFSSSAPPIVTPSGSWPGDKVLTPVEVTTPGSGPVRKFKGKVSPPPALVKKTA